VELNTWALGRLAEGFTAADVAYQKRRWNSLNRAMGQFHETFDLFLTPTLPRPPIKIGAFQNSASEARTMKLVDAMRGLKYLKGTKLIAELAEKSLGYISYTVIANMTGQPSMSVPMHWSTDGLPIGVMFSGRMGDETTLFRLVGQLEQEKPWFDRRPA
jgi:amidase